MYACAAAASAARVQLPTRLSGLASVRSIRGHAVMPLRAASASRASRLSVVTMAKKGKGFGKAEPKAQQPKKESKLSGGGAEDPMQALMNAQERAQASVPPPVDEEFEASLAAIRSKSTEEQRAAPEAPSALDAPRPIDYANPPSILNTLSGGDAKDKKDPDEVTTNPVLAVFALFGIVIFIITSSGSDLTMLLGGGGSRRRVEAVPTGASMTAETKADLQKEVQAAILKLKEDPKDADALENLGGSQFALGDFGASVKAFEKLTAARPGDKAALQSLGQAQYFNNKPKDAANTFKALYDADDSLDNLKQMTDAMSLAGQYDKARAELVIAEERAEKAGRLGGKEAAVGALTSDSETERPDAVQVGLLMGKVFSNWDGHSRDAATVYSNLVEKYPEDFRAFLARGVFFREQGKTADSDRMFIQAKFLAPDGAKSLVDKVAYQRR
eukprot:CAMPEP_0182880098 /NCGR_PEP_ID=MMETSP0034_2-20130328/16364_1 /TAXON_ID=156128 /ORGANISM="Nephroselmis pyriformis, Strain CCMP717" /LENGTH=443 /DNA_ID=CAMNT_0025013069 /DNA_START=14 /DNA_END=1345 /DNA_ORIENTATION=+